MDLSPKLIDKNGHAVQITLPSAIGYDYVKLEKNKDGDRYTVTIDRTKITESRTGEFSFTFGDEIEPDAETLKIKFNIIFKKQTLEEFIIM